MKKKELRQEPERAVILLSGGIDSATTLAIAKSRGYELYALSFDYHQRHKRELVSASQVASSLGVRKHLVTRFDLREIGGSALTSEIAVPKNRTRGGMSSAYHDMHVEPKLHAHPQIPVTYVPARNTIFLSFALAWAEVLNAGSIFIGANAVDYSGYPDCRPEYLTSFERTANRATKASVEGRVRFRIRAPLLSMKKAEIITTGASLGLDYALTWSCYDPQPKRERTEESRVKGRTTRNAEFKPQTYELVPCGRCDSCVFRAKGFEEAGIADPLLLK